MAEEVDTDPAPIDGGSPQSGPSKLSSADGPSDPKRPRLSIGGTLRASIDASKPMEKTYADAVVYFLLRLACQVNESNPVPGTTPPGEALSKRCVSLLKRALKPDIWPNSDPKLAWLDKFFISLDGPQPNLTNISVGLELLTYLIGTLKKEQILNAMKNLTKGLLVCINHSNQKIVKLTYALLVKLMSTFPTDPTNPTTSSSKYEELEDLYSKIVKTINDGLNNFNKNSNAPASSLYGTLMILRAACQNNPFYIDRLIIPLMNVLQRMARDHLNPPPPSPESTASKFFFFC